MLGGRLKKDIKKDKLCMVLLMCQATGKPVVRVSESHHPGSRSTHNPPQAREELASADKYVCLLH